MQVALGSELGVHDHPLPRSLRVGRPGVKTRSLRIFNHVAQAPCDTMARGLAERCGSGYLRYLSLLCLRSREPVA